MIPESKFVEIAKGLFRKTRQGKVRWEQYSNGSYIARLPGSAVIVRQYTSASSPTYISLDVRGPSGTSVGLWQVFEGEDNWQHAAELHSEIERGMTGWDKVLEDIERFIASDK